MKLLELRFNYRRIVAIDPSSGKPVSDPETGKPLEVFYPLVPLTISSKTKKSQQTEGLLDSGSDGIVLSRTIADYLGLELTPAEKPMRVADGKSVKRLVSTAMLTLGRGGRFCDPIETEVSVPAEGDPPILLGRKPVFELFVITFFEAERRFEMKPYLKSGH